MIRKSIVPFALFSLLAICSCSELDTDVIPQNTLTPIAISAGIDQQNVTRADEQGFVGGDRMGIYIVDYTLSGSPQGGEWQPGKLHATGNRASNLVYTFDADSYRWTAPTTIYWRDKETPVDVYAYYPSANYIGIPSQYLFEVQADQSVEARNGDLCTYEQSDLLWGKQTKVSPTSEVVTVKLSHRLAGVRVYIKKGEGISDTEWAKLDRIVTVDNTVRQATVDLSTGSAVVSSASGVDSPICMAQESGDNYRAIVIPQTVAAGKTLISITIDGVCYSHTLTQSMQYQAGKLHNYTITVNKSELTGDYSISVADDGITPWANDEQSHQFSSMQYVIVNCPEYGKLKESITRAGYDYKTVQNLKVTGELTTEDFTLLRDEMPELRHLNLKDITVTNAWIGHDFYDSNWHDYHADNILPANALAGCNNLRSLVLPSSLKALGDQSLSGMRGLMYSTLEIPEGVTKIGVRALAYNEDYNGVELILPATIDTICDGAFNHCGYRCELTLNDNITSIGGGAFDDTPNFYGTFHIPSKLKELPRNMFSAMGGWDGKFTGDVEIPQGISKIYSIAPVLRNYVELTIPEGVTELYAGVNKLTGLHLPNSLQVIGSGCFDGSKMPFQLKLPPNLNAIEIHAFRGCGLEGELVIPESCTEIGIEAFQGNSITKLTLPSKLETIQRGAFHGVGMLTQLTIPKYVNYIGEKGFAGNSYLQTVICLNPEPPTLDKNVFEGLYFDKCILEVPEQSVEIYRHTDGWKEFKNITAYHELAFNVPEIICLDKGITHQGILRAEGDWEVSECPSWVTVTPSSGSYKDELTVTIGSTTESREGRIVFLLKDKDYTTYTDVRQVFSTDYREDATVTLQEASSGATPIPLFLVGEGYGADDIASGQYLKDMKEQMEHLFSTEPYKSYRNYFTVSTAYACSPQQRLGGLTKFSNNNNNVWKYAQQHGTSVTDRTAVLVLCNTPAYSCRTDLWDNGLSFSWIGKNTDLYPYDQRGDVLHYLGGRGFGKLGPEYVNHFTFMKACGCPGCNMTNQYNWARSKGWWQNVSTTPKMTELPWYPFIFHEKYAQLTDVYEGALNHSRSTYRSENQSVMGAAHVYYYNTISRYEIVRRIMEAAGKSITLEQFIANDKIEIPED